MSNQIDTIKKMPLRQVPNVRSLLMNDAAREQLASVAAKHMNPERMMRVVANAIRTTPQLQEAEPMSMLGALMTCASLGLEPQTPLGLAYLIPFKNNRKNVTEVQLIIGYKGFADLARRSGQIVSLHADVVYSDDELWSYEYGTDMHLRHKPGPRAGKKTHAYCHVKLKDGEAFVVLPWEQILKTRDNSQGWRTAVRFGKTEEHPWKKYEDRMAAKTAVRALANAGEMPLSIEFLNATDVDDRPTDFRSFAMDPTAGVIIEGEASDMGEDDGAADAPAALQAEARIEHPAFREPEPVQQKEQRREAPPRQRAAPVQEDRGQLDLGTNQGEAAPQTVNRSKLEKITDQILNDLLEAPASRVMADYGPQIEMIKAHAPDLHQRIMNEAG